MASVPKWYPIVIMAAGKCLLQLPEGLERSSILLVLSYAGVQPDKYQVEKSQDVLELTTPEGDKLSGRNTICRYLASLGDKAEQLLGGSPEESAEVRGENEKQSVRCLMHKAYSDGWN